MERDLVSPFKKLSHVPVYKEREDMNIDSAKVNSFIAAVDPIPDPDTQRQQCFEWFTNLALTVQIFSLNSAELLRALMTRLASHKHHIQKCLNVDDPHKILENLSASILRVKAYASLDEILNFRMTFNETVESYFNRVVELTSRSDLKSESQQLDLILKGLPNDWKAQMVSFPEAKNVEELYQQLIQLEDRRRKLFRPKSGSEQRNVKRTPEKSKNSGKQQNGSNSTANITCFACGGKGHYSYECNVASDTARETLPFDPRNVTVRKKDYRSSPSAPSQPQKSSTPSDTSRYVARSPYKPPGQRPHDIAEVHEMNYAPQHVQSAPNNNNVRSVPGSRPEN